MASGPEGLSGEVSKYSSFPVDLTDYYTLSTKHTKHTDGKMVGDLK